MNKKYNSLQIIIASNDIHDKTLVHKTNRTNYNISESSPVDVYNIPSNLLLELSEYSKELEEVKNAFDHENIDYDLFSFGIKNISYKPIDTDSYGYSDYIAGSRIIQKLGFHGVTWYDNVDSNSISVSLFNESLEKNRTRNYYTVKKCTSGIELTNDDDYADLDDTGLSRKFKDHITQKYSPFDLKQSKMRMGNIGTSVHQRVDHYAQSNDWRDGHRGSILSKNPQYLNALNKSADIVEKCMIGHGEFHTLSEGETNTLIDTTSIEKILELSEMLEDPVIQRTLSSLIYETMLNNGDSVTTDTLNEIKNLVHKVARTSKNAVSKTVKNKFNNIKKSFKSKKNEDTDAEKKTRLAQQRDRYSKNTKNKDAENKKLTKDSKKDRIKNDRDTNMKNTKAQK